MMVRSVSMIKHRVESSHSLRESWDIKISDTSVESEEKFTKKCARSKPMRQQTKWRYKSLDIARWMMEKYTKVCDESLGHARGHRFSLSLPLSVICCSLFSSLL